MTQKKAVIITAIPCEYAAVRRRLQNHVEDTHHSGTVYEIGEFSDWSVLIAEAGAGNERSAAEAERAIEYFKPNVILFVGVAGGVIPGRRCALPWAMSSRPVGAMDLAR